MTSPGLCFDDETLAGLLEAVEESEKIYWNEQMMAVMHGVVSETYSC